MIRCRAPVLVAVLALAAACRSSRSMTHAAREHVGQEIRGAVDSWTIAVNRLDPGPFLDQASAIRSYAENLAVYPDADSLAGAVHSIMGSLRSVNLEWTGDPVIVVLGPDAGVFSGRMHETLTDTAGATSTLDAIWTGVYQRIDGSWKLVAAHESYGPVEGSEGS